MFSPLVTHSMGGCKLSIFSCDNGSPFTTLYQANFDICREPLISVLTAVSQLRQQTQVLFIAEFSQLCSAIKIPTLEELNAGKIHYQQRKWYRPQLSSFRTALPHVLC